MKATLEFSYNKSFFTKVTHNKGLKIICLSNYEIIKYVSNSWVQYILFIVHASYHSFDIICDNLDIYHHTNSSSNSSDNSNGYSVGRHPSYEFANNNFNNLSHKPYFNSSTSSSTSSSRTFRKNNTRPVSNIVGGNPNLVNSPVTINSTNVTHHIIHPDFIRQCQYNGNPDNRMTTGINAANLIQNTNNSNLLNNPSQVNQQNAPGHVRFTSASTATSSVSSYASSSTNITTHPKSILRRKNLNSSSNVMTSSNNNNQNSGWDNMQGWTDLAAFNFL